MKKLYLVDLPGYGYAKVSEKEKTAVGRTDRAVSAWFRTVESGVFADRHPA